MSVLFIQTIGGSKGNKVKIVRETGGFYLVRIVPNGLKYMVSKYNLGKYYEEVKRIPLKKNSNDASINRKPKPSKRSPARKI